MPGGFATRFVLEAGFLLLLGAGAGYADLRAVVITALLAGGWLVVSLVEVAAWRVQSRPAAIWVAPSGRSEPEVAEESEPEPEPEPPAEVGYPLRVGAGEAASDEVEAYTRVLGDRPENEPAADDAE
jgi:hypothetical protein